MAKNFKGKAQKPPLSTMDKVIYGAAGLLGFVSSFVVISLHDYLTDRAYDDPTVIACNIYNTFLLCLPLILLFSLSLLVLSAAGFGLRQPLLKSKPQPIPAFTHYLKADPLFSSEFWKNLTLPQKKQLQKSCVVVLIAFIVCLIVALLSIYPRQVLTQSHTFVTYNSFNRSSDSRSLEDAEKLVLGIGSHRYGYSLYADFVFDGSLYTFTTDHFRKMTREESLQYLLDIKAHFSEGEYRLSGAELIDQLTSSEHYSPAEAKLLYQLFDLPT